MTNQEEELPRPSDRHQHYEEDFSRGKPHFDLNSIEHEGRLQDQRVCGSSGAILMAEPRTEIEEEEKEHS